MTGLTGKECSHFDSESLGSRQSIDVGGISSCLAVWSKPRNTLGNFRGNAVSCDGG